MSAQSKADMKASMRWAIVTVAICSWIAVSNHCAFAAVATESDKGQTECPFHSKPAKQKEQSRARDVLNASCGVVVTRHRSAIRRVFIRRINSAAESFRSRSTPCRVEQSQLRSACRATAPVAVFPRGRRGACPTTRLNAKRFCSHNRERRCTRDERQRADRRD